MSTASAPKVSISDSTVVPTVTGVRLSSSRNTPAMCLANSRRAARGSLWASQNARPGSFPMVSTRCAVLGPGGGILQRGHDADAALMAGADEMQKVLAKSRLIFGVSGVVEKNADLGEVDPPGVVHVAIGLSRVVGQPVFRMANGGCRLVVESAHLRQVFRDVPFLRWSVGGEDREAGCKNENWLHLKTPNLGLDRVQTGISIWDSRVPFSLHPGGILRSCRMPFCRMPFLDPGGRMPPRKGAPQGAPQP